MHMAKLVDAGRNRTATEATGKDRYMTWDKKGKRCRYREAPSARSPVIYSDGEHNSNKAIHSELLNLAEYNMHVAKLVNAGRNRTAMRVCNPLLQILVTPDAELVSLSSIISWSHWQS
ncbi:hypothetical protein MKW98_025283 [Papaver atlanticum]|uniref:CCR4-NOT transcription complex subunit 1-like NOT1 connector domain-containing protein n=1 Tax=Papaver atlanticum TaxID=357466 RepID=A0AAD4S1S5_9MAGN|nr:hypothetical protein MKW98_025283 [Papaver atlanticum]